MANILLTSKCNRSCPYCFARDEMERSQRDQVLSWENLIYIADFLAAGGERRVSLLGGEPTTHPECLDFALYLVERGFAVTIFTNGLIGTDRLKEFERRFKNLANDSLGFVCNLNDPVQTPAAPKEQQKVERFLFTLGPRITPGFNIYRLDFRFDFLFDAINRYGLKRCLRLGLAHPIPGHDEGFIKTQDIRRVIERIFSYRPQFDAYRVLPMLDCGFPACQITDEELGWLGRHPRPLHFICGPALDIAPDMSVYHCFPLANYKKKSLFEFDTLQDVHTHFGALRNELKNEIAGIYPECDGCRQQQDGVCAGGGLCRIIGRFHAEAPVRLPEIVHEIAKADLS